MACLSAIEFARSLQDICNQSDIVTTYDVNILDDTVVKIRIVLIYEAFVDAFYNANTGSCSYALIEEDARIFGVDNAFIGWHIHPFDDPSQHMSSSEVSFAEFLEIVGEHFSQREEH
jgi:hypothetical protein